MIKIEGTYNTALCFCTNMAENAAAQIRHVYGTEKRPFIRNGV